MYTNQKNVAMLVSAVLMQNSVAAKAAVATERKMPIKRRSKNVALKM